MSFKPAALLFTACCVLTVSAVAQLPDKFENLQVLPKTISKSDLLATMIKFSLGTGIRCEGCHVGEGGPNLKNMQYPLDDKPTKRTARAMYRMMESINQDIAKMGIDAPIRVECATCHHGVNKPQPIDALMSDLIGKSGTEAAAAKYRQLRKDYYGQGSYDFTAEPLLQLAQGLMAKNQAQEAAQMLELNLEFNPPSPRAYFMLGEAWRSAGDTKKAREAYQNVLKLNPENARAKARLEELDRAPTPKP